MLFTTVSTTCGADRRKMQRDWGRGMQGLDVSYRPGPVKSCCWCANRSDDGVCGSDVSSRGHLAPLAAFQPSHGDMLATNVYLNTAPTRQPFDGAQWARREKELIDRAKMLRRTDSRGGLHVVVGTSLQTDGTLQAQDVAATVDVPSFLWAGRLGRTDQAGLASRTTSYSSILF
eukprot:gnl/TRDRNA2_/TRDRNA2_173523_c0_seq12.p1 gnl/TRDRNA2_/TRDRNA2_173523_c0~~gnl/TRDRNA2_/TRDRNA2_173523_c0_seq12.p1  ORF type:complete len:174 (-),score=16.45 gnl/TRDRNA2_/TRDRNA2_173523_c0_seq12:272-793(-)